MIKMSKVMHALLNPVRFLNVTEKQETKCVHTEINMFERASFLDFSAISSVFYKSLKIQS